VLLTLALAAGAAAITYALLRLNRHQPSALSQAETLVRLAGQTVGALARVIVLAADVLRVLTRSHSQAARTVIEQDDEEQEAEDHWGPFLA